MKVFTLDSTQYQSVYNDSKTMVLQYLERNGLLKEGLKAEDLDRELVIVHAEKGMFGKFFDKFWGTSDKGVTIFVAKIGQ